MLSWNTRNARVSFFNQVFSTKMAKSIHSKHKIKMRNEKRKRYYVRELNNLKKLVTEREARRTLGEYSNMKTADQIALERKQQKLEKEKAKNPEAVKEENDVNMDEEKVVRVYDKSMKDHFVGTNSSVNDVSTQYFDNGIMTTYDDRDGYQKKL
ncbi:unnamed protein product [Acanthosepion pharaonis]|uniref:Uncharacterized protein n=1 Tax=Acanthosepion pharaonis TaxID=158019 RepID=A0A812AWF2_ACAPH|nr:unnamed protein product [Sepia pharaonis]